jgi:hypothetical protein
VIATVTDFTELVGVPIAVAIIGLAATLGAAAISFALGRWSDSSARRRDGYAQATKELVAWAEYPYRIRRRTTDDPATLTALADRGHTHQEALRYRETWIAAENRWVAKLFKVVREDLAAILAPACNDAWARPPVANATEMTLGDWGPAGVDEHITRFEKAVEYRFGWRRWLAIPGLRLNVPTRPVKPTLRIASPATED